MPDKVRSLKEAKKKNLLTIEMTLMNLKYKNLEYLENPVGLHNTMSINNTSKYAWIYFILNSNNRWQCCFETAEMQHTNNDMKCSCKVMHV